MQGTNKTTGKSPKKPRSATDEAATDEPNPDEKSKHGDTRERPRVDETLRSGLVGEEPLAGPARLEITDIPTSTEPNILESAEILGEGEGNNVIPLEPVLAGAVDNGGGVLASDLSAITPDDGLAILDEYFPRSATGLGPLDGGLARALPMAAACVALPDSPIIQAPSTSQASPPYPQLLFTFGIAWVSIYLHKYNTLHFI